MKDETKDEAPVLTSSDQETSGVLVGKKSVDDLCREVEDALSVMSDNEAYLEAKRQAPEIVRDETDFKKFLLCFDNDVMKVASAIVSHWSQRKKLFGERAFLPMNLTSEGALTQEDIDYLYKGSFALLPKDKQGHQVFAADRSVLSASNIGEHATMFSESRSRLRTIFYLIFLASLDKKAQTDGMTMLRVLSPTKKFNNTSEMMFKLLELHAVKVHAMFWVFLLEDESSRRIALRTAIPASIQTLPEEMQKKLTVIVRLEKDQGPPEEMLGYFKTEGLPASIGGTWVLDDFANELDHRKIVEMSGAESTSAVSSKEVVALSSDTDEYESLEKDVQRELAAIPNEQKAAYLEVVEKAPDLVQKESSIRRFLIRYGNNAKEAAEALVHYWKFRKNLFGDRAFLPLNLSGSGALTSEDIQWIQKGAVVRLPNDNEGRSVYYFDLSRAPRVKIEKRETHLRARYYLMHLEVENERTLREGFVGVRCMSTSSFNLSLDKSLELITAIGLRVYSSNFVIQNEAGGAARRVVSDTIEPVVRQKTKAFSSATNFYFLDEPDQDHPPADFLKELGLKAENVPSSIGGRWDFGVFDQWLQERIREDAGRPLSPESSQGGTSEDEVPAVSTRVLSTGIFAKKYASLLADMDAMVESSPDDVKAAYVEASKRFPDLVRKETNPIQFLFCEGLDADSAACRLLDHWRMRVELFGKRAFHAMNQTGKLLLQSCFVNPSLSAVTSHASFIKGEGALCRNDIAVIGNGSILSLPDNKGKQMLVFDPNETRDATRDALRRVAFYMLCVAGESSDKTAVRDITVLIPATQSNSIAFARSILSEIIDVMPLRVDRLHAFFLPSQGGDKTKIESFGSIDSSRISCHTVPSLTKIAEKLESLGIAKSCLPKTMGGARGVKFLAEWQDLRIRYEWSLPPPANYKDEDQIFDFSWIKPPSALSQEERNLRGRRLNVLHSRRKRERERMDHLLLNEKCVDLRVENDSLREEGARLEQLLLSADAQVKRFESLRTTLPVTSAASFTVPSGLSLGQGTLLSLPQGLRTSALAPQNGPASAGGPTPLPHLSPSDRLLLERLQATATPSCQFQSLLSLEAQGARTPLEQLARIHSLQSALQQSQLQMHQPVQVGDLLRLQQLRASFPQAPSIANASPAFLGSTSMGVPSQNAIQGMQHGAKRPGSPINDQQHLKKNPKL